MVNQIETNGFVLSHGHRSGQIALAGEEFQPFIALPRVLHGADLT